MLIPVSPHRNGLLLDVISSLFEEESADLAVLTPDSEEWVKQAPFPDLMGPTTKPGVLVGQWAGRWVDL